MSVSAKKGRTFQKYYRNEEPLTVEEVKTFPCVAVPQLSLRDDIANVLEIRSEYSQEDGETIVASYLPYYNQDGKLTGYKRRDWTKDKEEIGHFTVIGVVKVSSRLFGQHICKPNKKSKIYICEGEGDQIATYTALIDSLKGTKFEGKIQPNVVSLNCGAGNAKESVAHNEEFIRSYSEIVCLMDNDEASELEKSRGIKKGKEACEDIASYLLSENFYVVDYPEDCKDPRDWFNKDPNEFAKTITWNTKKFSPEKILEIASVDIESLRKKKKKGIPLRHLKKLQKMTKSPIKSELWTLTSASGAGKSTIAREVEFDIAKYLMEGLKECDIKDFREDEIKVCSEGLVRLADYEDGEKLGIIRLEEGYDESLNSLYAMDLGIEPKSFVENPDNFITEDQHNAIHNKWKEKNCTIILDHFGSLKIDSLINKLKQMMAYGCRWFLLDHYTMLVSGMRTSNDVKELDIIMTELAAFCKQYNVFIFGVSHISRKKVDPPKDKEGNPLPFFSQIRKEDMRGSSSLEALSWVIILLEPEELPNRSRGRVRLVVGKNRRGKVLGIADTLWQKEDGTYVDASDWEVEGECFVHNGQTVHCFGEAKVSLPNHDIPKTSVEEQCYQESSFVEQTGLVTETDEDLDEPF